MLAAGTIHRIYASYGIDQSLSSNK
jgi:hypothetical protein